MAKDLDLIEGALRERVKRADIDSGQKALYPVRLLCDVLDVKASGYYAWLDRPTSPRKVADTQLLVEIKAAMARGRGAYGSPRVHRELRAHDIHEDFATRPIATASIGDYVERFYNTARRHSHLGYVSRSNLEQLLHGHPVYGGGGRSVDAFFAKAICRILALRPFDLAASGGSGGRDRRARMGHDAGADDEIVCALHLRNAAEAAVHDGVHG
jgi:hypothetical protein